VNKSSEDHQLDSKEMIDILPCALYVIKDSVIINCNKSAVMIFGYKEKQEIIGLRPYELSPNKQQDGSCSKVKGEKLIDKAITQKENLEFQWIHKRKSGQLFLTDIRLFNKNDTLYAYITETHEMDQLKRHLEEKNYLYDMLFENNKTVMMIIDFGSGKIIEANQAAINYYGYTQEILLNMRIQDINIISQAEMGNNFQFTHCLANKELRQVEIHSFPINRGKEKLLFYTIYDISDQLKQQLMFDTLFFDSPYSVVILDKEQKIININKTFTNVFEYSLEDVTGKAVNYLATHFNTSAQIDQNIQVVYEGEIIKQEGIRKRKDGVLLEVSIHGYPIINDRSIIGAYIVYIDISSKKASERQLLLFKKVLENISEAVVITDNHGDINWINKPFNEITGYSLEEVIVHKMNIINSGIHDKGFYNNMWKELLHNGKWSGEIWNKNKKGNMYSGWLTINSIDSNANSNGNKNYVGVLKDLSEKKETDRKMVDLQNRDSLTGLHNRNHLLEMLDANIKKCKKNNQSFSIIYLDIDGFREINDSLGHIVGDKILIEISKRLQPLMNKNFYLSRFSGDEFVILCCKSDTKEIDVSNFAKLLLYNIKQPFLIDDTIFHISASIGISRYPESALDAETLIRFADIAMSKANVQAQDKICVYSEEMSQEIEAKFRLANYLVKSIINNELIVFYQPIFDIVQPKKIMAAEALLRWQNPILGMVSPEKFIHLAENTGQIISIGEWVLEQVCKQINIWKYRGYEVVPIAVNISVKQLEQVAFSQIVIDIMRRNDIKSDAIELEITESVSSGDHAIIVENLKRLKQKGITISMDDFGTGFSSLGQLHLYELDKLKIDKIFIDDLISDTKRQNLVKSIIAMANSLDLIVVAEGIETIEQLYYLKELGCQLGQGYLFSKPLPAKEIEGFFNRKN